MLTLVIGNKRFSSWSLRPWILLKQLGLPFEERFVQLHQPGTVAEIVANHSPAGRVPVLKDGALTVWESLAICEHVAEQHPGSGAWPTEPQARALCRSIATEMHAGFGELRKHCTFDVRRDAALPQLPPGVAIDLARIDALIADARHRFGEGGPFLFGAGFTVADAMYAPVAFRIRCYRLPVSVPTLAWVDAVLALPAMREWAALGFAEPIEWT